MAVRHAPTSWGVCRLTRRRTGVPRPLYVQSRLARMGQMVGFARATSDGVLSATIWDVAILPAWQRSGLGRALMERLTARLVQDDIPTITLVRCSTALPRMALWEGEVDVGGAVAHVRC